MDTNEVIDYIKQNIILCNVVLLQLITLFYIIRKIVNKQNAKQYYFTEDPLKEWDKAELYLVSYYLLYVKEKALNEDHMLIGLSKTLKRNINGIEFKMAIMGDGVKNYKGENILAKQCYLFMEFLGKKRAKKLMNKSLDFIPK